MKKKKKKKQYRVSLRLYFTFIIMAEFFVAIVLAVGIAELLSHFNINIEMPTIVWIFLGNLFVSGAITNLIGKWFFDPITRLGEAMSKVASGDFTVQLKGKRNFREVQDIYKNFNLMVTDLSKTEILQTDFVSNVSHEFKTPISAIEGYATLLQGSSQASEEQLLYADKILFNTKRLSNLVGSILLLSKVENQTILPKCNIYRLDEQIRQSIVSLEPEWSVKNIDFDVNLEKVDYIGNEGLMMHVWNNLIGNAIKFDPQDGIIIIKLYKVQNQAVFTIEDNGSGISVEALKYIYDKFYQSDRSHDKEGNGLGLALVKRILCLCGGEISVENTVVGCRFTVILPMNL